MVTAKAPPAAEQRSKISRFMFPQDAAFIDYAFQPEIPGIDGPKVSVGNSAFMLAPVGTKMGPNTLVGAGLSYMYLRTRFSLDDRPTFTRNLHIFAAAPFFSHFSENWMAVFQIGPSLGSDLRGFTGRDIRYTISAQTAFFVSEKLVLGPGLIVYTGLDGGTFPVPTLRLEWRPHERHRITGTLPFNLRYDYALTKRLTAMLFYLASSGGFMMYVDEPTGDITRVAATVANVRFGPCLRYAFVRGVSARVSIGPVLKGITLSRDEMFQGSSEPRLSLYGNLAILIDESILGGPES